MRPAVGLVDPMAVSAVSRERSGAPIQTATVPAGVLALTLVAPALDLLRMVEPGLPLDAAGLLASALTCAALLGTWARYPRTSWLLAAALAAIASVTMRLLAVDVAPLLSLLTVVGLGIGGAFAPGADLPDSRATVGAPDLLGRPGLHS
jgi:hypothetical protein